VLPFRHIAIEGPIGAGKSSLARRLAAHLGAELLLEKPEENPFLERFYADGSRYAFQTQLFFLFQRVEQYRALAQPGMFTPRIVSDFMFAKDALFARLTLSDEEYRLYLQIHQQVAPQLPAPDLVVWLQAGPPALQQRIQRRGIGMEQAIPDAYLERLSQAYAEHFEREPGLPVLAVDTEGFHPAGVPADFERLLAALRAFRGPRETLQADAGPAAQTGL
jgi:deoxyadenosine/deoxycytidine kinase